MSNFRITANRMFALEGLRGCLQDTSLPYGELLGNIWLSVDVLEESMDENGRWFHIKFKIRIMHVQSDVIASCTVERTEYSGRGWDHGSCNIEFPEDWPGLIWNFEYRMTSDGKMTASGLNSGSALRS